MAETIFNPWGAYRNDKVRQWCNDIMDDVILLSTKVKMHKNPYKNPQLLSITNFEIDFET